jgi:hypothetical protein
MNMSAKEVAAGLEAGAAIFVSEGRAFPVIGWDKVREALMLLWSDYERQLEIVKRGPSMKAAEAVFRACSVGEFLGVQPDAFQKAFRGELRGLTKAVKAIARAVLMWPPGMVGVE